MADETAGLGQATETTAPPASAEVGNDLAGAEQLTDEQLLGIDTDSLPAETETIEQPATEQAPVEGEFGVAPPAWLKQMYGNPEYGKQAQALWDQTAAYRQLYPTVAEARIAKEAVEGIGGVDAIQELVQKGQSVDQTDAAFFSGDPQQQSAVIAEMFEEDRDAFTSGVSVSLEVIRQRDPERYGQMTTEILGSMLKPERFDEHIEAFRENANNPEALTQLVNRLVQWADSKGLSQKQKDTRLDPRQQQVAKDKEQLNQERQSFQQERYKTFSESVDSGVRTDVQKEIGTVLTSILPKTSEGTRSRIAKDILTEIDSTLKQDRNLTNRVAQLLQPTRGQFDFSKATQDKVQQLLMNRAKQLVNGTTKKIVSDWTKDVLARNRETSQKTGLQQTRVDITGGAPPGSGRKAPLTKEKAATMTDAEILNY